MDIPKCVHRFADATELILYSGSNYPERVMATDSNMLPRQWNVVDVPLFQYKYLNGTMTHADEKSSWPSAQPVSVASTVAQDAFDDTYTRLTSH